MHIDEMITRSLSRFIVDPPPFEQHTTDTGSVEIKTIYVHFPAYPKKLTHSNLPKTYRSKTLVMINDDAMYGELAILRCLEDVGFNGVWVDTFHGRGRNKVLWTGMPPSGPSGALSPEGEVLYDRIVERNLTKKRRKTSGGFFDVFAWKDGEYVFLEYKGSGDFIRPTQRRWISAATSNGIVKPEQLFLVQNVKQPIR